jgi:hypothetical protein
MVKATQVLDQQIESRFFWAPVLEQITRCVAPNVQLTAIDGQIQDDDKSVTLLVEGFAAAREPRSAAEDLRQMLFEQLEKSFHEVKVEFKMLEDAETFANIGGIKTPMAHFNIAAIFKVSAQAKATPAPTRVKRQSKSE